MPVDHRRQRFEIDIEYTANLPGATLGRRLPEKNTPSITATGHAEFCAEIAYHACEDLFPNDQAE